MKYSLAARFLGKSRPKSEIADFFLNPAGHPELIMSLLIEKKRQGEFIGKPGAKHARPLSGAQKAHKAFRLTLRYLFLLSLFMFISCAVAPNTIIAINESQGIIVEDENIVNSVETMKNALEAAWQTSRSVLAGDPIPESVADSFAARLYNGRWAGIFLMDPEGGVKGVARADTYPVISDWISRYNELDEENRTIREGLAALRKSQDSKKIYLEINLEDNLLFVKMGSQVLYKFPVVTGKGYTSRDKHRRRSFATPRGILTVVKKEKNPIWHPPAWHWTEKGREVPEHRYGIRGVLGKRRLNLGHSYGIHGTSSGRIRPGKYSHGCIRMNRKDIDITFKLCDVGTQVYIY